MVNEHMQELGLPPIDNMVNQVNPELAEILIGYKNALDAALMATRLISSAAGGRGSSGRQPPPSARRTDTLEVRG